MDKANELSLSIPPDTDLRVLLDKIDARTVTAPKVNLVVEESEEKKGQEGLSKRALKRVCYYYVCACWYIRLTNM